MTHPEIRQIITNLEDIDDLKSICGGIVGQQCFQTKVRHEWVPLLDFGIKIPLRDAILRSKGYIHGSWFLMIHTSNWRIKDSERRLHCSPDTIGSDLNALVQVLNNTNVVSFEIGYPSLGLDMSFTNGYKLVVTTCEDFEDADPDDDNYVESCCWELHTPEKMIAEVGPHGHKWSYTPFWWE